MTASESLRGVRPEEHRSESRTTGSDGARKPRADRIGLDFDWSDQDDFGWTEPGSQRRTRRSGRHDERPARSVARNHGRRREEEPGPAEARAVEPAADILARAPILAPAPVPAADVVAHAAGIALSSGADLELSPTPEITPVPSSPAERIDASGARGEAAPARRTVVIRGNATRGYAPSRRGYEARLRPHERSGFKPDRVALWAVLLGLALLLGAVTSSHAATLHAGALHQLLLHRALIHPAP